MRQNTLSWEHQGARAILNALERLAGGYDCVCNGILQDTTIAEGQLRDYQARLGRPFIHDGYLGELASLRDQLKTGDTGAACESGKEVEGPSISKVAGRIKAIQAGHSVEASPHRVRHKHSTAEGPITARVRQRMEERSVSDRPTEAVEKESGYLRETVGMHEKLGSNRQQRQTAG